MQLNSQGVMITPHPTLGEENALKCELASEVLRSSGVLHLRVTGWSMLPTVLPGDTLVIQRISYDAVSVGDIVLFGRDRRFFVHRVVMKGEGSPAELATQGDAMPAPDPPVYKTELLGRVTSILRNGRRIEPTRSLGFSGRAVAALAQHSTFAAQVILGVHAFRQSSRQSQVQASDLRTSQHSME